jgi:uncharacterized integral membrane protein (TIGR00697 family)
MKRSDRATSLPIAGVLVVAAYTAAQMLSDVLSLKIARVAGFSIDAGTFIYPFTFTLRDLVHKLLGRAAARAVIVAAGVVNLLMAGLFAFAAWLPPDPTWPLQREFVAVLTPVWRIVVASIVAEIGSEFADTEVYHLWVTRVTRRYQWARVLVSNTVSVPLDSLGRGCWSATASACRWTAFSSPGGRSVASCPLRPCGPSSGPTSS